MVSDEPNVIRPKPRRPFSLATSPSIASFSGPESPSSEGLAPSSANQDDENTLPPSRTRSILNLTSSTLFGIYSPTGYNADRDGSATPWGTGAETPIDGASRTPLLSQGTNLSIDEPQYQERTRTRRKSMVEESAKKTTRHSQKVKARRRKGFKNYWVPLAAKTSLLGLVGVSYGVLISNLHDKQQLAPVPLDGIPRQSWSYIAFWGVAGVIFGRLLPWVDHLWAGDDVDDADQETVPSYGNGNVGRKPSANSSGGRRRGWWAPEWNDVVRIITAFIGIAFAIRKLPWQSTLQLSLTLALSNPAVWYLVDRSPPGFVLSTTVALTGTALALAINPQLIPTPAEAARARPAGLSGNATLFKMQLPKEGEHLVGGLFSQESVGVATWIASVLFVSCICFGNIGRRLK